MYKFHSILCVRLVFSLIIYVFISCASMPEKNAAAPLPVEVSQDKQKTGGKKESAAEGGKKLLVINTDKTAPAAEQKVPAAKPEIKPIEKYKIFRQGLVLRKENSPATARCGRDFSCPFTVLVENTAGKPLANQEITVKYPSGIIAGRPVFASEEIFSDSQGRINFTAPLPEFSCNAEILFYPAPSLIDEEVLSYAEEKALRLPFKVYTNKTNETLSISMVDYTDAGKPVTSNSLSSSALLKELYLKGFRSIGNSDFVTPIDRKDIKLLYSSAKTLFNGKVAYLIFGTVKRERPIAKTEKGTYSVSLIADISVMDMKTGNIILTASQSFFAEEKTEWAALEKAHNKLLGPGLADYIYYAL